MKMFCRVLIHSCCFAMLWVILFTWIRDRVLSPQTPEFRIDSAALSQLDVTSAGELTASLDMKILVINPNVKLGIDLYSIEAMLFYQMMRDRRQRLLLAAKPVTLPFFMTTGNQTTVTFKLSTSENTFVQHRLTLFQKPRLAPAVLLGFRWGCWHGGIIEQLIGSILEGYSDLRRSSALRSSSGLTPEL